MKSIRSYDFAYDPETSFLYFNYGSPNFALNLKFSRGQMKSGNDLPIEMVFVVSPYVIYVEVSTWYWLSGTY